MGSPITLSGFNQIDFSVILNAIMQQERQPVVALESQKRALEAQKTAFGALASKLASLESAVESVVAADAFRSVKVSASDTTRLSVSAEANAAEGSYQVYVDQLARAQVSTSQQAYADTTTTKVAGAGTLAIGGVNVTLTDDVTLQGLVDAINAADAPATASIVRNTSGQYQLMLTGAETGATKGFSIDVGQFAPPSGGGATMSFTQVQAPQDARVRFNGVTTTSESNTFNGVINGLSFTALKEDATTPVTVTITADFDSVVNLVQKVVAAFNDATSWIGQQTAAAARQDENSVGRDPFVRTLRSQLSQVVTAKYDVGGSYTALAEIGFEFTRTGQLTVNETKLREALADNSADLQRIFRGSDGTGGAFGRLGTVIEEYTKAGGLVPNAQSRVTAQLGQLSNRIGEMEERLAIRRAALQREFAAADATLSQLNAQRASLESIGSQFSLF